MAVLGFPTFGGKNARFGWVFSLTLAVCGGSSHAIARVMRVEGESVDATRERLVAFGLAETRSKEASSPLH